MMFYGCVTAQNLSELNASIKQTVPIHGSISANGV